MPTFTAGTPPPAEIAVEVALVRRLLEERHPNLKALPLSRAAEGWDNVTFRLGNELAVRVPAALARHAWWSTNSAGCRG